MPSDFLSSLLLRFDPQPRNVTAPADRDCGKTLEDTVPLVGADHRVREQGTRKFKATVTS